MSLAPPKPSPLVPGYRLDRYELLCPIADGGMASVWVARMRGKHGFEKLVAIKTILPKYAEDLRFQQMFLDEARIASRIEHANVAQILDLGEEHDVLYLVMEWVDGDALSKLQRAVERKHMMIPTGIVVRILADTCGGLHAAHELREPDGSLLGVVHRDVSPQNVLVSSRGIAKLIDFGIAKARDRVAAETNAGFLKGKIQYMAPEQALGQAIDRRADVWAIGAIAYHLLSGRPPYEGANQLATLHLLTSGKPPLPLPPTVPAAVAAVVRKSLTHDPGRRYATAAEMQVALEGAIAEAKLATTQSDIAAFTAEHLAERAEQRKHAIDIAQKAALERARMTKLLKPTSNDSASGVDLSSAGASVGPSPAIALKAMRDSMREPEQQLTAPAVPRIFASVPPPPPSGDVLMQNAPLSETSSATLGVAALESPLSDNLPLGVPNRKRAAVAVLSAVAVIVLVIGVAAFTMRSGDAPKASAAVSPVPSGATGTTGEAHAASSGVAATSRPADLPIMADAGAAPSDTTIAATSASTPAPAVPTPTSTGRTYAHTPPAVAGASPPPRATPPSTAAPPPKKRSVDDGF